MVWWRRVITAGVVASLDPRLCAAPGAVLTVTLRRAGARALVSVTTNLSGSVYYHWYVNGRWIGVTQRPQHWFHVQDERRQIEIECVATKWSRFDHELHRPLQYHGHPLVSWIRSASTDVAHYLAQYRQDAGEWTTFQQVRHVAGRWQYRVTAPLLADGSAYEFRVVPVNTSAVAGTPIVLDTVTVVRTPPVTAYVCTYDEDTDRVTFDAA